jgi:hypothetical protein
VVHDNFRSRGKSVQKRSASALADQSGAKIRESYVVIKPVIALKFKALKCAAHLVLLCPGSRSAVNISLLSMLLLPVSHASSCSAVAHVSHSFSNFNLTLNISRSVSCWCCLTDILNCFKAAVILSGFPPFNPWFSFFVKTYFYILFIQPSPISWTQSRRTYTLSSSAARSLAKHGSAPLAAGLAMVSLAAGATSTATVTRKLSRICRSRQQLRARRRWRGSKCLANDVVISLKVSALLTSLVKDEL